MPKRSSFSLWLAQVRANFLVLAVFLVFIGLAVSYKYQEPNLQFNWFHGILLILGVVSAHISVNLFNEYSDYRTKIDFNTRRTPFSGGSGMLTQGLINPRQVLRTAIITLTLAFLIGLYFTLTSHWIVLVFSVIGALTILFYTDYLARYMLGEFFCGLTLGTFVVLGTYISLNASPGVPIAELLPAEVILISIPPGILTSLLLFLNEFPDAEADRSGGRNHLVIRFGFRKAALIYITGLILTFGTIVLMPLLGYSTYWLYLALLPLPMAVRASVVAFKYNGDIQKIIPALGNNVITVLGVDLLLAVGVFVGI
ncbi:MAG: prenyltransferase [Bacteroidales bacterium]|nr:prenyltransferase [Bacteroidales bacterium]